MKAKVIKAFRHTNTGLAWLKGETFDGSLEDIDQLARMGYLERPATMPGRTSQPDFKSMTVRELVDECDARGIDVPMKPKKAQLVALLEKGVR